MPQDNEKVEVTEERQPDQTDEQDVEFEAEELEERIAPTKGFGLEM